MSSVSWNTMLPVVVSPSNEGWTYMKSENCVGGSGEGSLYPFVARVNSSERNPSRQFAEQIGLDSRNIFRDLEPRFIESHRFPVSWATLNNTDLTKIVSFRSGGDDIKAHIVKLYSGLRLGQNQEDRFIQSFRDRATQYDTNRSANLLRVNVDDISDLALTPSQPNALIRVYGENLVDMRERGARRLSPLADNVLRNEDVLVALSDTVNELRRVNICVPWD